MHDHAHHGSRRDSARALRAALVLAAAYMAAEVAGGLWTGSLALLADAGHMLSDVAALALGLFALWIAERPATPQRTFGFYRAEILAALVQGAALVVVAALVALEAVERLDEPRAVLAAPMLAIAAGGLAVNLVTLRILARGRHESMSVEGAWLHVLSDAFGSGAAMAAGAATWAFGWAWADPAASLAISALIVISAWRLLAEATGVLLEGVPRHIDLDRVRDAVRGVDGIEAVHDLHVWSIATGMVAMSCHVVAKDGVRSASVLACVNGLLRERFGIQHTTIQIEPEGYQEDGACE